jgi:hypothetical protein
MTPPQKPVASGGTEPVLFNMATPGASQVTSAGTFFRVANAAHEKKARAAGYGLRNESLSPMETLA